MVGFDEINPFIHGILSLASMIREWRVHDLLLFNFKHNSNCKLLAQFFKYITHGSSVVHILRILPISPSSSIWSFIAKRVAYTEYGGIVQYIDRCKLRKY